MTGLVVDTSAVLAILQGERGATFALERAEGALFSTVNYAEALAKASDRGVPIEAAAKLIAGLGLVIVPFDQAQATVAASLRATSRYSNVSQADRACLALAIVHRVPVLTGDRDWSTLGIGVETVLFR